ncbi:DUF952 domain-containing protein [Granulosicoccus antarcticus]|uniref:DUF952 domain-containing protein n=1 Tax=Granulosicoccus antarcticus IMCC3135 TaxID=1192854 RepID=A0A2Z2P2E1_9GAMM|nr:DUF952 domain-containing protein [Granulosicoccus antarcticus]ASJ75500.1 hypothetical protein IMCC3135_27225 [Granulosicoccus antarcticus IMCC3135]
MSEIARIFHIAQSADILPLDQGKDYRCASLDTEGFIHCCDQRQLSGVVSRYYNENDAVQLMIIEVDKIEAPLILENTVGGAELFPHIYGPINASCIIDVVPFGIHSDERMGLFE